MIKRFSWLVLLGACLILPVTDLPAADDVMDRLMQNLEEASEADPRYRSDEYATNWPRSLEDLRAEDLEIPSTAAEKSALARDPRIDPSVQALIDAADRKGIGSLDDIAKDLGVPYEDRRVLLRLVARDSRDRERLEREVDELGGEVTAVFEEVVMARVPPRDLNDLPGLREMLYVAPQAVFEPAYDDVLNLEYLEGGVGGEEAASPPRGSGATVSEGVSSIGAERLHGAGISGKGVKIGIIDFGFQLYDQLRQRGEVSEPAAARAFNQTGQVSSRTVHGTACAEIIHDMAPDAALYLAAIDGADDQVIAAASWLADQGVDIISFSGGGHGGPHNGQALIDRFVEQMMQDRDIAWIVAAGNEGADHWIGQTADANGDALIDVDNPKVSADVLLLEAPRPTEMMVLINWDDWGPNPTVPTASQDIDAHLYVPTGSDLEYLGGSTRPQNGRGAPLDLLRGTLRGGVYVLALHAKKLSEPVNVHVVAKGIRIHPIIPRGSVANPAASNGALAVGAVDVRTGQGEPFSSRGPTDDGRLKPEVAAPDNNISVAYGSQGGRFPGTSAACPHVAGFAALIKQQQPELSPKDLFRELVAQVRPMGQPVPNNRFGHGHIDATKVALGTGDSTTPDPDRGSPATESDIREYLEGVLRGAGGDQ